MTGSALHTVDRREFLKTTAIAAAATVTGVAAGEGATRHADGVQPHGKLIDVSVSLSRWPCRRLPLDDASKLGAKLHSLGVVQAWAGSFEALLHKDLGLANARLAEECRTKG